MHKERIALITGGSRGIGKEIAETFARNNIKVLTPSRLELDLLDEKSIYKYVISLQDNIDILVNNAGINPISLFSESTDTNLIDCFSINLLNPMRLTRELLKNEKLNVNAKIVNISSIWSVVSKQGRTIYSVSKAGIDAFTRSLAIELAESNILVNSVAPGFVLTELTKQNNSEENLAIIKNNIPLKRLADPSEIAKVVSFLSSLDNTYLTGQTIVVDGGYSCL